MRTGWPEQIVQVELLDAAARLPTRAYEGDAGFDLHCVSAFRLDPGERALVGTGVAIALAPDIAGLVVPRSGLASRDGVTVVNGPGLVDPNYRGEIRVALINLGHCPFEAQAGERIAQILFVPISPVTLIEGAVSEIKSARGVNGFGSSGR